MRYAKVTRYAQPLQPLLKTASLKKEAETKTQKAQQNQQHRHRNDDRNVTVTSDVTFTKEGRKEGSSTHKTVSRGENLSKVLDPGHSPATARARATPPPLAGAPGPRASTNAQEPNGQAKPLTPVYPWIGWLDLDLKAVSVAFDAACAIRALDLPKPVKTALHNSIITMVTPSAIRIALRTRDHVTLIAPYADQFKALLKREVTFTCPNESASA